MGNEKLQNRGHLFLLHLAVMMFGFSGVISRAVQVSAITLAGGRVICSSAILFLLLKIKKESLRAKSRRDLMLTLLAGALLAVHWTTFFQSVQVASVAIGTITFSTFPLFLLFLEPLLYKEPISGRNILLSMGLLLGVFITIPEFSLANGTTMGILWGMICSLTYALLTLCNRTLAASYSGMWVSFREQSTAALLLLPFVLIRKESFQTGDLLGIAAIGVICTALAFSLFVTAQKSISAQTVGIVAGMETVYGILFAGILLREMPSIREIIGGIVILAVAMLSTLSTGKK
ncbi:MAG: DMT family transporter [Clostridiales bacterium]|nr:DMT family transporter [Candidatus Blautia equi]